MRTVAATTARRYGVTLDDCFEEGIAALLRAGIHFKRNISPVAPMSRAPRPARPLKLYSPHGQSVRGTLRGLVSTDFEGRSSDRLYVLGPRTLGSSPLRVLDGLAFLEPAEGVAFHRRAMEEDLAALTRDETKALVRYQLLDRPPHHPTLFCSALRAR
jgi:hypothetical protein